jgi:hypothetical protein
MLTCWMEGDGDDGVLEAKNIRTHALRYVPHTHLGEKRRRRGEGRVKEGGCGDRGLRRREVEGGG